MKISAFFMRIRGIAKNLGLKSKEKSVLIVPGDHFGLDHFVRISFCLPNDYLVPALDRIHELISELKKQTSDAAFRKKAESKIEFADGFGFSRMCFGLRLL